MSKVLVSVLIGLAPSVAHAECAWGDKVETADATMTTVTINGKTWSVKGAAARAQFLSVLTECKVSGAATAFDDWRSMRRWTNITGVVGACCLLPVLFATPVTAVLAGDRKADLLMTLSTSGATG